MGEAMGKPKVHKWQDRIRMSIDGGPMRRSPFGHCGSFGEVTDDWEKVTCKKCLKYADKALAGRKEG